MRALNFAGLLLVACPLVCCKVATQTDLRFDAGPMNRARAVTMRVEVRDRAGEIVYMADRPLAGPGALPWPNTLPLVPMSDRSGFMVTAELLDSSGRVFAVQRVRSGFVRREHHVLEIFFQDTCIGILCTPTTTCLSGTCVLSERPPVAEAGPSRADRQPGVCLGGYCYEHPRPGPYFFSGACVGDGGVPLELVVGNQGVVLRRDSDVWVQESTPVADTLRDVECWDQEAVAVGGDGAIVQRDATGTWSSEVSGSTAALEDVSGASPDDAWAVGAGGTVLRRTPAGWESLDAGTDADLTGVWSPRREEAWIAADPALLHYADGAWESVSPPGAGAFAVAGREGELLVLGRISGGGGQVYRRDETRWTQLTDTSIGAVSIDVGPDGAAAVGGGRGLELLRPSGGAFAAAARGSGNSLRSTAVGSGRALFVGSRFISRWGPGGSRAVESVSVNLAALHSVAHAEGDDISALAVGDSGTVLRRANVGVWRWEPVLDGDTELTTPLRGVTATGTGWVIAGDGVLIERPYGATPSFIIARPTDEPLFALANNGSRLVAVGANGTIVERTEPGSWVVFADPFPAPSELTAAAWETSDTLIVGTNDGEIWRHDGGWSRVAALGVAIGCLRNDGEGVLACAAGVHRVNPMGTTVEFAPLSSAVLDVVPGPDPILVASELWGRGPVEGAFRIRLHGDFEAASVGTRDLLFVGAQGTIVRSGR